MAEFVPTARQARFIENDSRYSSFNAGIGAGKTAAGSIRAINKVLQGESGIILAPNFPQLCAATFPELMKWLPWKLVTNRGLGHPYAQSKVLKFAIEGKEVRIYYGSYEHFESFQGIDGVSWLWLDDVNIALDWYAFDSLDACVLRSGHPQVWTTGREAYVELSEDRQEPDPILTFVRGQA